MNETYLTPLLNQRYQIIIIISTMKFHLLLYSTIIYIFTTIVSCKYVSFDDSDKQSFKKSLEATYISSDTVSQKLGYVNTYKIETSTLNLSVYQLINGKAGFTVTRPEKTDQSTLLSIAASFTAKDLKNLIGTHIVNGQTIAGIGNPGGYCAIWGNKMVIKSSKDSLEYYRKKVLSSKGDLFRQIILVKNGKAMPCELFKRNVPLRAIAVLDGKPTVIETVGSSTIEHFSRALAEIGVTEALYADMGSWSYGWYRNKEGRIKDMGTNFFNTHKQTNWFVFREN